MHNDLWSHLNVLAPESVFYESSIAQAYLLPANSISWSDVAFEPLFFSAKERVPVDGCGGGCMGGWARERDGCDGRTVPRYYRIAVENILLFIPQSRWCQLITFTNRSCTC